MRLLMTPAAVTLSPDGSPVTVTWAPPGPRKRRSGPTPEAAVTRGDGRPRRVLAVIDSWRYDGRWWEGKGLHRDYFFVELEGGVRVELFSEEGDWWVARVSD